MSYNGSGTFQINTSGQPVVAGTVISSTAFNALTADLATGLSTAITKDGQTTTTARIPFAAGINSSLTTDSTSTATGSIITSGGVGIAKTAYIGTNLSFAGTGNRITGDFSNATHSSRALFQTSTANSNTAIGAIPLGTGNTAQFIAYGNGDPTNSSFIQLLVNASEGRINSGQLGAGSNLPMTFYTGGSERVRIDTAGNVGIGTNSPGTKLDVSGNLRFSAANPVIELNSGGPQVYSTTANTLQFASGGGIGSATERMRIDSSGNLQMQGGAVMPYAPAPTSIAAATTFTNAQLQTQIINTTGTTYSITMQVGSTLETLATWATTGIGYDFFIINTASGTITINGTVTGVTSLGSMTIATGTSAHFRIRRTAANTFVLYRLV